MNQCRSILLIISKSRESGQPNIPLNVWPLCGLCFVSFSGLLLNDAIMLHLSMFSGVCILCRTICRLGLSVFFSPHSPVIKLWDLKWEDNAAEVSVKEAWSTCSCNLLVFWTRSRTISYMPLPTDCFTYVLVSQVAPHYNGDLRLHGHSESHGSMFSLYPWFSSKSEAVSQKKNSYQQKRIQIFYKILEVNTAIILLVFIRGSIQPPYLPWLFKYHCICWVMK